MVATPYGRLSRMVRWVWSGDQASMASKRDAVAEITKKGMPLIYRAKHRSYLLCKQNCTR
jgi:hypothetical protein